MNRGYRAQKERKAINAFLRSQNCPPIPEGVDKIAFGRLCLKNFQDQQSENESRLFYDDVYGPISKPQSISEDYDLGSWN